MKIDEKDLVKTQVYLENLAEFMLEQIDAKERVKRAPLVCSVKKNGLEGGLEAGAL